MDSKSKSAAAAQSPQTPSAAAGGYIKKLTSGATFLSLEHVGHMALVVMVPALLFVGAFSAFSMWTGTGGVTSALMGSSLAMYGISLKAVEAMCALGVIAALLVVTPLLVILDRRTRAEWQKRTGYAGRLAYKVPVYVAMGVTGAVVVSCAINALYVVIASLALVGVQNVPIDTMYVTEFLPAVFASAIFTAVFMYLYKLAKGRDNGRRFSFAVVVASAVVVIALFITSITVLHSGDVEVMPTSSSSSYDDLLNQLYQ